MARLGNGNWTIEWVSEREERMNSFPFRLRQPKLILASKHNMNLYVASDESICTSTSYRLPSKFFSAMKYFRFENAVHFNKKKTSREEKTYTRVSNEITAESRNTKNIFFTNLEHKKTTKKNPKCFTTTTHLSVSAIFFFSFKKQSYKNHNGIYHTNTTKGWMLLSPEPPHQLFNVIVSRVLAYKKNIGKFMLQHKNHH